MCTGRYFLSCDGFGLRPLATRDSEGRAQISERVSCTELPVRLVQMEPDDREKRRRGDRSQDCDGPRTGSAAAAHPTDEVSQSENAEPTGPGEIREEERISGREPRAQRRWQ